MEISVPQNVYPFRGATVPLRVNLPFNRTASNVSLTNFRYITHSVQSITPTAGTPQLLDKAIGILSFPSLPSIFKVPKNDNRYLPRKIKPKEYETLMRLVNLSMSVLDAQNISYTLTYGSLLGSVIMHDMLPWDDDVDIFVHNDMKSKVMDLFKDDRHYGIKGYHHYNCSERWIKMCD